MVHHGSKHRDMCAQHLLVSISNPSTCTRRARSQGPLECRILIQFSGELNQRLMSSESERFSDDAVGAVEAGTLHRGIKEH